MYSPPFNRVNDEAELRAMVADVGSAWLLSAGDPTAPPEATLLPIVWREDRVIAHIARANAHWKALVDGMPVRLVVPGPDAYVSPTWYAAKAEHHRVVPTWNYTTVHLTGTITVHDDAEWVRQAVTELTDQHEAGREDRWHVSDAPADYVSAQLRGIVGLEVLISGVEGKAKLSQNRSEADRRGVIDGLEGDSRTSSAPVAGLMTRTLEP